MQPGSLTSPVNSQAGNSQMVKPRGTTWAVNTRSGQHYAPRAGFTLIELMIVIVIIAILVALLLPAVFGVQRTVRVTQVRAEIGQLEAAIAAFKLKYGVEPPSSIKLWESPPAGGGFDDWRRTQDSNALAMRGLLRSIWPRFATTSNLQIDFNGDGDFDDEVTLTGGEALAFFLGGILSPTFNEETNITKRAPIGFSRNPNNPFLSLAEDRNQRDGPFFEFNVQRFVDLDNDGFPEYLDTLPGQTKPYQYFSSYEGSGYNTNEFGAGFLRTWYRQTAPRAISGAGNGGGGTDHNDVDQFEPAAFKAKGFQIISAGPDKEYGAGGPYDSTKSGIDSLPPYELFTRSGSTFTFVVEVTPEMRDAERDNITNFAQGMLAP